MTDLWETLNPRAPMWNGAPAVDIERIGSLLLSASFHYADDSGGEWQKAQAAMEEAAGIANQHKLSTSAIRAIHTRVKPLVSADDIIDAMLVELRHD